MAIARPKVAVYPLRGAAVRPAAAGGWECVDFIIKTERDEEGWLVATVPQLPGCYTQARDQKELYKRIWQAIEAALEDPSGQMNKLRGIRG